jgi:hypothetical protein
MEMGFGNEVDVWIWVWNVSRETWVLTFCYEVEWNGMEWS